MLFSTLTLPPNPVILGRQQHSVSFISFEFIKVHVVSPAERRLWRAALEGRDGPAAVEHGLRGRFHAGARQTLEVVLTRRFACDRSGSDAAKLRADTNAGGGLGRGAN